MPNLDQGGAAAPPAWPGGVWGAIGLAALAIVFTVALTFATISLPSWLGRVAQDWIAIPDYNPAIEPAAIEAFLDTNLVRPIGYGCLAAIIVLILVGLLTQRLRLSTFGAVALFVPTFGYFAASMFFLAGIGVLRAVWLPAWSDWLSLGDVAYVPYMAIVWPLWELGVDARAWVAAVAIGLGLLVFVSATLVWLMARTAGRDVATSWLYRHSRHPQYLGWILWSWGFMLLAGQQPIPFGGENPGAALPWVISTVVIVAVAWSEEGAMLRSRGEGYAAYRRRTPFLVPVPRPVGRLLAAPRRWIIRTDPPLTGRQILAGAGLYLVLAIASSLPFMLLGWPPNDWWGWPM